MIDSAHDVYEWAKSEGLIHKKEEQITLLIVDLKKDIVEELLVGMGDSESCIMSVEKLARVALSHPAEYSFILVHNHPYPGEAIPSEEDIETTKITSNLLAALNRDLSDHVIVADGEFYSFDQQVRAIIIDDTKKL
tara:strand:+ start:113 stop:520 length:408 start_codon:yes stop_codon:yes gene_type:complete